MVIALCFSPRFWIYRLEVHGNETISADEVIRLAQLPAESNYYRTTLHDLERRILFQPRIQAVTVRRQSVGVLAIDVHERQAVCQLGHTLPLTYLDNSGCLFVRPIPPVFPVPVVEGLGVLAHALRANPCRTRPRMRYCVVWMPCAKPRQTSRCWR